MSTLIVEIDDADDFYAELLALLDVADAAGEFALAARYTWSEEGPVRRGSPRGSA